MRTIKFRGKSTITGEWAYGYYSVRGTTHHFISFMNDNHQWQDVEVIPESVGEWVSLKDKNGKEIYEGDIFGGFWSCGYVVWCDKCRSFQYFMNEYGCGACMGDVHWYELVDSAELEVIGNIYENPGLLQGGE